MIFISRTQKKEGLTDIDIEHALKILKCQERFEHPYPIRTTIVDTLSKPKDIDNPGFDFPDAVWSKKKEFIKTLFEKQVKETVQKIMSQFYTDIQIKLLNSIAFYEEILKYVKTLDEESSFIIKMDHEGMWTYLIEYYVENGEIEIDCVYIYMRKHMRR